MDQLFSRIFVVNCGLRCTFWSWGRPFFLVGKHWKHFLLLSCFHLPPPFPPKVRGKKTSQNLWKPNCVIPENIHSPQKVFVLHLLTPRKFQFSFSSKRLVCFLPWNFQWPSVGKEWIVNDKHIHVSFFDDFVKTPTTCILFNSHFNCFIQQMVNAPWLPLVFFLSRYNLNA